MYFSNSNQQNDDRERGAGIVEYALLVGLIAFAAVVGMSTFGSAVSASMITAASALGEQASPTTSIAQGTQGENVDAGQAGRERSEEARNQASPTTSIAQGTQGESVDAGQAGRVRFENVGGRIRIGDLSPAEGWTAEITKYNGRRATVVFISTESGERIIVNGWINQRGQLETKFSHE